jgi:hypothetical protein
MYSRLSCCTCWRIGRVLARLDDCLPYENLFRLNLHKLHVGEMMIGMNQADVEIEPVRPIKPRHIPPLGALG